MRYGNEREMYPAVCTWLERFLKDRFKKSKVSVYDSSRSSLARLIAERGLETGLPPHWHSWDIQIDVVGFAQGDKSTKLAFVECKFVPLNLAHVSQLLGYSRVAMPEYSFLISSNGIKDSLLQLFNTYSRHDILIYTSEAGRMAKSLTLALWNSNCNGIDYASAIPAMRR